MNFNGILKRGLAAVFAYFLLNASALAYVPAVHEALHAPHEQNHPSDSHAAGDELCSVQNHLAAIFSPAASPDLEIDRKPESILLFRKILNPLSPEFSTHSRAPPVSPVHP